MAKILYIQVVYTHEQVDERLKKGIQLFNQEEFYECHEMLEDLWRETRDEYRDFYKGLIQAAVALHHFKKGNLKGAKKLFDTSIGYLHRYRPAALGLQVQKLIDDMTSYFGSTGSLKREKESLARSVRIPKIEWKG